MSSNNKYYGNQIPITNPSYNFTPEIFIVTGSSGNMFNVEQAGTTFILNLPTASTYNSGSLSSTDWNNFNNSKIISASVTGTTTKTLTLYKADGNIISTNWTDLSGSNVTLTTTGTSGAATYIGGVLNIPQYQSVLTNPVTGTGTTNELTYFSGTSAVSSLSTATYPSLTELSYVKGVTSAIQTQLNGKQATLTNPITGTGTSGQIGYFSGSTSLTSSSNLFWDSTNNRLGIGTNTPANTLDVNGSARIQGVLSTTNYVGIGGQTADVSLRLALSGFNVGIQETNPISSNDYRSFEIYNSIAASSTIGSMIGFRVRQNSLGAGASVTVQTAFRVEALTFGATIYGYRGLIASASNRWNLYMDGTANNHLAGNLYLGSTTDSGYKLDVNGNIRIQGLTSGGTYYPITATTLPYFNNGSIRLISNSATASPAYYLGTTGLGSFQIYYDSYKTYFKQINDTGVGSTSVFLFQTDNRAAKLAVATDSSTADASFYGKAIWDGGSAGIFRGFSATQSASIFSVQNFDGTSTYLTTLSSGNVGIGTSSPSYTLDVNGIGRFNRVGNLNHDSVLLISNTDSNNINFGYNLKVYSDGSNRILELDGFNTTSKNFVGDWTFSSGKPILNQGIINNYWSNFDIIHEQSNVGQGIRFFSKSFSPSVPILTILQSGNVVIGTTSDNGYKLDVNGTARVQGVLVQTITTNRQTASYTLALTDNGKLVEMNVASANNLTVPLNSSIPFPVGAKIDLVQYGAGQTTIVATSGVTIRSANSWLKLNAQYGAVSLIKIATDEWYAFGNLSA